MICCAPVPRIAFTRSCIPTEAAPPASAPPLRHNCQSAARCVTGLFNGLFNGLLPGMSRVEGSLNSAKITPGVLANAPAHAFQKSTIVELGSDPFSCAANTTTRLSALASATTAATRSRYPCPSRFHTAALTGSRTAFMFQRCRITRNVNPLMARTFARSVAVGEIASNPGIETPRNTNTAPAESTSWFAFTRSGGTGIGVGGACPAAGRITANINPTASRTLRDTLLLYRSNCPKRNQHPVNLKRMLWSRFFSALLLLSPLAAQTGIVTTIAGTGGPGFGGDGGAASAHLFNPADVLPLANGNLLIAYQQNSRILQISPSGAVTPIAGNGLHNLFAPGSPVASRSKSGSGWAHLKAKQVAHFRKELPGRRGRRKTNRRNRPVEQAQILQPVRVPYVERRSRMDQVGQQRIARDPLLSLQVDQRGVFEHRIIVRDHAQGKRARELIIDARASKVIHEDACPRGPHAGQGIDCVDLEARHRTQGKAGL